MARVPGLTVMTNRSDFLQAARGRRAATPGFILQAWNRGDECPPRIGFTCSKKVGNAVARNAAKRRLRALARLVIAPSALPGYDYVLIGRANATASRNFAEMEIDLNEAIKKVSK